MIGSKVEVYWNLHKKCWSIRHAHGNLIADRPHRTYLEMEDVTWVVQQGGRERVLREGKKNVHAFARGTLIETKGFPHHKRQGRGRAVAVTYNPYKHNTFINVDEACPLRKSQVGLFTRDHIEAKRPAVWAMGGE
jgi:hypothetical protein